MFTRMFTPSRRIWIFSTFVLLIFVCLIMISMYFFINVVSKDINFRHRRVINAIANYSKLVPFESIHENDDFESFTEILKDMRAAPYVIFFDSSNIDVLLNHVCNLEIFPESVERLAVIAMDPKAQKQFQKQYPEIPIVLIDMTQTKHELEKVDENRKHILYQLVLLTRARVLASLSLRGLSFWSMQQDTIWSANFGVLNLENRYPEANLLFDTIGNDLLLEYRRINSWICGSTFYVKGNPTTFDFFRKVDIIMTSRFSPDSSIMTYLCGYDHYKCDSLPKWVVSSSNYLQGPRENVPVLVQMDVQFENIPKMRFFNKTNLNFLHKNGTCNKPILNNIHEAMRNVLSENVENWSDYHEGFFKRLKFTIREILNIDPRDNKFFMGAYEHLI